MRKFNKRNFLDRSILAFLYIILFTTCTRILTHLAISSSLSRGGYFSLVCIYIPLTFLLISLCSMFFERRLVSLIDLCSYLLIIPVIHVVSCFNTLQDPYVVLKFAYLSILYLKIGVLLIFLFRDFNGSSEKRIDYALKTKIFVIPLVFFFALTFLDVCCRQLSGDEPHYLLATHSLIHDFDFSLLNNYEDEDYLSFYPEFLENRNALEHSGTNMLNQLGFGFPYLLLPGYALLGRLGAQLTLNIITAWLILILTEIIVFLGSGRGIKIVLPVTLFSCPFVIYSRAIYPEMLIAFLSLYLVRLLIMKDDVSCKLNLSIILLSFLLIITKLKNLFFLLIFLLVAMKKYVPSKKVYIKAVILISILIIYIPFMDYYLFGEILYEKVVRYLSSLFIKGPVGFLGLLFDQEFGLLIASPVFILVLIELFLFLFKCKSKDTKFKYLAILLIANYSFTGFWQLWHGLSTPAPRYLVPLIPLLLIFLAKSWEKRSGFLFYFLNVIFLSLTIIYGFLLNLVPDYWYNWCDGSNTLLENMGKFLEVDLVVLLPSFIRSSPLLIWQFLFAFVFLAVCGIFIGKKRAAFEFRKLTLKNRIHFISAIVIISIIFFIMVNHGTRNLPTRILQLEDVSAFVNSSGVRYPLQKDPWYGGRYLESDYNNGLILYPSQKVDIKVKTSSVDYVIYIYIFNEQEINEISTISIKIDDSWESELNVNNYSWGEFIMLEDNLPDHFEKLTITNITAISEGNYPVDFGLVIDKIVIEYK